MLLIIGKEYCKIDSNGRFKFPVALKRQLDTDDGRFVVRRGLYANCLELWTYESFKAEVEGLQKRLNPYNREDVEMFRKLNESSIVELDSSDRMLIPAEHKGVLQNSKEIVLQSMGRFIEIWDYDQYQEMNTRTADMMDKVDARLGRGTSIDAQDDNRIS